MRILIADDEAIIRMGLKAMLVDLGHDVFSARDGAEAIDKAAQRLPELAILDIEMPATNGLQAAKAIYKKRPIPIIILTAFSAENLIEEASELPIHGYLIKPVEPEDIKAAIAIAKKRFADVQSLEEEKRKLQLGLEARKLLDRAKGVLMSQGMDEETAYQAIQREARNSQRKILAVAKEVILNGGL